MEKILRLLLEVVSELKRHVILIPKKMCSTSKCHQTVTIAIICHEQSISNIEKIIQRQTRKPDKIVLYYSNKYFGDIPPEWEIVQCPNLNDWGHGKCKQAIEEATSDFICFFNADSHYEDNYLAEMMRPAQKGFDVVLCDFKHRPESSILKARPIVGGTDRGNVLVSVREAQRVGYNHTIYQADGLFAQDLVQAGASWIRVKKCLYINQ